MMKRAIFLILFAGVLLSCSDRPLRPVPCDNRIVAHRGGSWECGYPDNSLAALSYAMDLGCYASECDFYITKDNRIVMTHATEDSCYVEGAHPWEQTLDEIRSKGILENGEPYPTLEDFLDKVMVKGNCTRLWLDIKRTFDGPGASRPEYAIAAAKRSCEIIRERHAEAFVEFICSGVPPIMDSCVLYAREAGIPIGWMAGKPAEEYERRGYDWINLNLWHSTLYGKERTIGEFLARDIDISVYVVDNPNEEEYIAPYLSQLKAITTGYPKRMLELTRKNR